MANRINNLRKQRGLTQRQLAEMAGTTQQTIQRLETGQTTPRFDIAISICRALEAPLPEVFPDAQAAAKLARKLPANRDLYEDRKTLKAFEEAGFEMDLSDWSLAMRFGGGASMSLDLAAGEKSRIWSAFQSEHSEFVIMDSDDLRVAINCANLKLWQFKFESFVRRGKNTRPEYKTGWPVEVWLTGESTPCTFHVDLDEHTEENEGIGQIGHMFSMLETAGFDYSMHSLLDIDGERVFFRTKDINAISCPLEVIEEEEHGDER